MKVDRIVILALFALAPLSAGWESGSLASARTPFAVEHEARLKVAASQPPSYAGQIGSFVTDPYALITAMDIPAGTVTSATLTGGASQSAVFSSLGAMTPTMGGDFVWLSTGVAGSGTPQTVDPSGTGTETGTDVPPSSTSCGTDTDGITKYDCFELSFTFTVPANMNSVAFDFDFMSVEYPEFVGQGYDDSFQVSLQSPSHNYSNIVFDAQGNPVSIDSAFFNEPCTALAGSGFDIYDFSGNCDAGGTGMLTTSAPVTPGETVTITFRLFDKTDSIYDTAVMIDNFVFSDQEVQGPTTGGLVSIDYISPKSGPLAGGTAVLIYGDGFVNVQQVAFDGIPALFSVLDETTIQAFSPPHSEGAVDLSVTAQPGNTVTTGVRLGAFTYYVSPAGSPLQVLSVDPAEGPASGGVAVAVRGSGFKADTVITFDGEAVESQEFINGDEIVIVTPAGSGSADVRATNPDGTHAQLVGGYVYFGDAGGGNGTRGAASGIGNGCSCSLESTTASASSAAAPLAIAGLALAVWLARRRPRGVRLTPNHVVVLPLAAMALALGGCNDSSLAPVNSAPIADAGPSGEAFIGEPVTLDGTESRDFESGTNITFAWEFVTKPAGSAAELDDPSEKTPTFFPDVAGLYRIGLVVVDADGVDSGPIGFGGTDDDNLTDIVALPYRDLRVTLTWDQDSDLDLHFIRPNTAPAGGYWNQDHDCFYGSPDPEWGAVGIEADNPLLAQDVDTGMGPEEIVVPSPQDLGDYAILVHVFNQHGAPPANATVTIEVENQVLATVTSAAPLGTTDAVWRVGVLSWPENEFTELNTFTTHSALNGPPH